MRSLILAPTRELAAQVSESFETFSTNHNLSMALLIGGTSFADQEAALDKGVDVLIATPGRLLDHFERGKVLLQDVKILVIDEADRMLDMGFIPDIERIVSYLPVMRQTLFFSATLSDEIHKIGSKFVMNPKIVEIDRPSTTANTITQRLVRTKAEKARERLSLGRTGFRMRLFSATGNVISTLLSSLKRHDFSAVALHGDMTQSARLEALDQFKSGEIPILIASDVAARGLDILLVSHVFNFDIPSNAEDYVHRIGRTGRAGRTGVAITLVVTDDDEKYLAAIETLIGQKIPENTASLPARQNAQNTEAPSEKSAKRGRKRGDNADASSPKSAENSNSRKTRSSSQDQNTNKYAVRSARQHGLATSFQDCDEVPAFLRRSV